MRAAEAHLRFVTIHPFKDGNGRVGRLLLNFVLIRAGYPPAVILLAQRTAYIEALMMAERHGSNAALLKLVADAAETGLRETLEAFLTSSTNRDAFPAVQAWLQQAA